MAAKKGFTNGRPQGMKRSRSEVRDALLVLGLTVVAVIVGLALLATGVVPTPDFMAPFVEYLRTFTQAAELLRNLVNFALGK